MNIALSITPHGRPVIETAEGEPDARADAACRRIAAAFQAEPAAGLLHLATAELQTPLPSSLSAMLRDVPSLEESGLVVRVPDCAKFAPAVEVAAPKPRASAPKPGVTAPEHGARAPKGRTRTTRRKQAGASSSPSPAATAAD